MLRFCDVRGIGERVNEDEEDGESEEGLEPADSEPDSELEGSSSLDSDSDSESEPELSEEASLLLEDDDSVSLAAVWYWGVF